MKKVLLVTSILAICLITLSGCLNSKSSNKKYYDYYLIHSGYIGEMYQNEDASIIISSEDELNEYIDKYGKEALKSKLEKYDKNFFKKKSLALHYIELSSGSIKVTPIEPTVNGSIVVMNYKEHYPEIGTCDMNGYVFVVEVDKGVEKIISNPMIEY